MNNLDPPGRLELLFLPKTPTLRECRQRVAVPLYSVWMEATKIIAACVAVGAVYGILHDQVTARVCLEYFTVFHPDVFHTQSPTLLAIGWGILATWWGSLPLGIFFSLAARAGSRTKLTLAQIVPGLLKLSAITAVSALMAGIMGYFLQGLGMEYYATTIPKEIRRSFYADLWAHEASYLIGLLGGIVLCIVVWRKREHIGGLQSFNAPSL